VLYLAPDADHVLWPLERETDAVLERLVDKAITVTEHNWCKTVLLAHVLTDVARREHMHLLGTGRLGDVLALAWTRGQVLEPPVDGDGKGKAEGGSEAFGGERTAGDDERGGTARK
jgi:hypothetical protein